MSWQHGLEVERVRLPVLQPFHCYLLLFDLWIETLPLCLRQCLFWLSLSQVLTLWLRSSQGSYHIFWLVWSRCTWRLWCASKGENPRRLRYRGKPRRTCTWSQSSLRGLLCKRVPSSISYHKWGTSWALEKKSSYIKLSTISVAYYPNEKETYGFITIVLLFFWQSIAPKHLYVLRFRSSVR